MPDNNTLEAQLLQRAQSIAPTKPQVVGDDPPGQDQFENQQPDILSMLINLGGLNNASGGSPFKAAAAPLAGTLASRADSVVPRVAEEAQLSRWAPVQHLLGLLKGFNPSEEDAASTALNTLRGDKVTGFRVPEPTPVTNTRIPEVEIPQQFLQRPQSVEQRLAAQKVADARLASDPPTPLLNNHGVTGQSRYNLGSMNNKVNPDIVKVIRKMAADGKPLEEINKAYPQLKPVSLRDIINRNSWSWVK